MLCIRRQKDFLPIFPFGFIVSAHRKDVSGVGLWVIRSQNGTKMAELPSLAMVKDVESAPSMTIFLVGLEVP